jgi:F420-non-reducing hydrogenase large subunit
MSIKKVAEGLIRKGADVRDGVLNRIEMVFRAYGPCFECATHAPPGQMPPEAQRGGAAEQSSVPAHDPEGSPVLAPSAAAGLGWSVPG